MEDKRYDVHCFKQDDKKAIRIVPHGQGIEAAIVGVDLTGEASKVEDALLAKLGETIVQMVGYASQEREGTLIVPGNRRLRRAGHPFIIVPGSIN